MSEQPNEKLSSTSEREISPRAGAASNPIAKRLGSLLHGCFALIFLIWAVATIVLSIIGLITGYLYLPPARGGEIELHGSWARIVSAIILLFFALITFLIFRNSRRRQKPKILDYSSCVEIKTSECLTYLKTGICLSNWR